ncbi:MAG TPA: hypothetical protein VFY10_07190, partial [Dehalococcoidia bacterium]|nr:hypothetical protein [Dehalococcoidia bacterium]
ARFAARGMVARCAPAVGTGDGWHLMHSALPRSFCRTVTDDFDEPPDRPVRYFPPGTSKGIV